VAIAASVVVTLSACGSDTDNEASSSTTRAAAPRSECPQEAHDPGAPEWTLPGDTGTIGVSGPTDTTMPLVKVSTPFSVNETHVRTLKAGDGAVVPPTATVSVCYMGVDGRDGRVFDSSYNRGTPVEFELSGVVPGFQKAITGQKVGSSVAVAMASADGYPDGQPRAGIEPGDSLIFVIKILDAS
jgi:hypothetical protein